MFRSITDEKIKTMSKEKRIIAQSKDIKTKKMYIKSMKFNSTKAVHLAKTVTRVTFLRFMYVVVYSIVNVIIENIKIKAIFNSGAEINYMFKQLIDTTQFSVRQNINMIIINVINERVQFFNISEIVFLNIESITISIFVFVVKRSNHELFLERCFQCAVRINFTNMKKEFFEMILYSLNEKK